MAEMALPYRLGEKLELVTKRSVDASVLKGDKVTSKVSIQPDLVLPVQAGQVYGKDVYTAGGLQVASVDLVAARSVAKVTLGLKVAYFWHRLTKWLGG